MKVVWLMRYEKYLKNSRVAVRSEVRVELRVLSG